MKVEVSLAKAILAPVGITAAASAIDAGIKKKQNNNNKRTLFWNKFNSFKQRNR